MTPAQKKTLDKYKTSKDTKPAEKGKVTVRPWRVNIGKKSIGFKIKWTF